LIVETKPLLSGREARDVVDQAQSWISTVDDADGVLVFARYATAMARERLAAAGVSYLDLTGNVRISIERPAVYIERQGAARDPDPPRRGVQSLKGAKAARIVRGLCDWRAPIAVRELARRTGANAGYVTRVVALLEEEDLVLRDDGGSIAEVRWPDLLRRWAVDYSVTTTNRAVALLAPRGVPDMLARLSAWSEGYAVTGSFAVPPAARVAPGRSLTCYVPSAEMASDELELVRTDAGANVLLLEPFDDVVFERLRSVDGVAAVGLSQCAVDLLTGSGREPAEGEALLTWMTEHQDEWRT
jgi:hypothetical protein